MDRTRKRVLLLFAALLAVHLAATLVWLVPAYLTVDEVVYHFISESLVDHGQLQVWNGYQELPSPELGSRFVVDHAGRLVASYPAGFALLSAPFYLAGGLTGLFAANALAFAGVVYLTYALANRVTEDRVTAAAAAAILAAATFAWEYSQAIWPHMAALLLILAAVYTAVRALQSEGRRAFGLAAAAGLCAGLAIMVRLDSIFVGGALLLPPLLRSPPRWRLSLAAALGHAPPLLALALANQSKFGSYHPLSYGPAATGNTSGMDRYLPLLLAAVVGGLLVWTLTRRRVLDWIGARRLAAGAGLALLIAIILIPPLRHGLERLAAGAHDLLVDFRPPRTPPETSRGESGGVFYYGGLKKALLQSCPYLAALPLAFAAAADRPQLRGWLLVLLLAAAPFVLVFSYLSWHGGMCINMRYLLPVLPLAAVAMAAGIRALTRRRPALAALAVAAPLGLLAGATLDLDIETRLLLVPLGLAAAAAIASLLWVWLRARRPGPALGLAGAVIVGLGLGWSAATAFGYDYAWSRRMRWHNAEAMVATRDLIASDSLLVTTRRNELAAHLEHGVRIAQPAMDDWADFRRLIDHHLAVGRPVYLAASPGEWRQLRARGALAGLEAHTVWRHDRLVLAELSRAGSPPRDTLDRPWPGPGD